MSGDPEVRALKAEQRRRVRATRDGLEPARRRRSDAAIHERLWKLPWMASGSTFFCFISQGSEVDTRAVLDELLQRGKSVLVPRLDGRRRMLAVPFHDWSALEPGQLGIPTPVSAEEFTGTVDVCITPGLAFGPGGERLGFGRGYYDGWLAAHPDCLRIAPAYACQVLDAVAVDAGDIPVDIIVTEDHLLYTGVRPLPEP